jgi:hypothetical protein
MSEQAYFEQFIGFDEIEQLTEDLSPIFGDFAFEVHRYNGFIHDTEHTYTVTFWIHDYKALDRIVEKMEAAYYVVDADTGNYIVFRRR